jgi:ribonuclease HI
MIEVWYDGCCEPVNPGGNAGFGALIKLDGVTVWQTSGYVGSGPQMSNNVAEYSGMIGVLTELIRMGYQHERVLVRGDNMMTIQQMAGHWRAKCGLYLPYFHRCKELVKKFSKIRFQWIPREQNGEADELSKAALHERGVKFRIQPQEDPLTDAFRKTIQSA